MVTEGAVATEGAVQVVPRVQGVCIAMAVGCREVTTCRQALMEGAGGTQGVANREVSPDPSTPHCYE